MGQVFNWPVFGWPWTDEERDPLRAEAVEALGWEGMEAYQDHET